jgi:large repetitive protein
MPVPRVLLLLTAGALATGGSLCAAGAAQAESESLTYSCSTALGPAASTVVTDTDLPDVMDVGDSKPVGLTSTVTVPWAGAIQLAYSALGARTASGTATALGTITGPGDFNVPTSTDLTVPTTDITENDPLTITSTGTGDEFAPTVPGVYTISAGNFTSVLTFLKADNTDFGLGPQTIPCTAPSDVSTVVDTVTVKTPTTTTLALEPTTTAYGQGVAATATVSSDPGPATGAVEFTVGGDTVSVPVTDGTASTTLSTLHAGTQQVTATFVPDDDLVDGSSASQNVTVTKADTRTKTQVTRTRLHHAPKASVAVSSAAGTPTGKVTVVLKKGTRTLNHKTVTLDNGKAAVVLKSLPAKGRYTLTVTYAGKGDFAGSKIVKHFRVR